MGWAVGWDREHSRFRGYGVPAYCDAKGCGKEIDRGLGYVCECLDRCFDMDDLEIAIFVCSEHSCSDVDEANLPPEHPDWICHVLSDDSWEQWRSENPQRVNAMRDVLARSGAGSAAYLDAAASTTRAEIRRAGTETAQESAR